MNTNFVDSKFYWTNPNPHTIETFEVPEPE